MVTPPQVSGVRAAAEVYAASVGRPGFTVRRFNARWWRRFGVSLDANEERYAYGVYSEHRSGAFMSVVEALPPLLCKFRPYANPDGSPDAVAEGRVHALLQGRLYFSSLYSFNDPFEARPLYVPAYEDAGRQRAAMFSYISQMPTFARRREGNLAAARLLGGKSMKELVEHIGEENRKGETFADVRVFCLSDASAERDPLPWAHYARSHTGVCIHFDSNHLPLKMAYKVEYSADYPTVPVPRTNIDKWEYVRRSILRKAVGWQYEKEYRAVRVRGERGPSGHLFVQRWDEDTAVAASNITRRITLGVRMHEIAKNRLRAWIRDNASNIEIYQATLHKSQFELDTARCA